MAAYRKARGPKGAQRKREYTSPLRASQADGTRKRILEALLAQHGNGRSEVSVPQLAKIAGVSVPTIYRHFPTRTALLQAVVQHADAVVPAPKVELDPNALEPAIRAFFEHRAKVAAKLGGKAYEGPFVWELRRSVTVPRRREALAPIVHAWAPTLGEHDRTLLLDSLVVLLSHTTATAFREYLGCTPAQSAERVSWIFDALRAHAQRKQGPTRPARKGRNR